MKIYILCDMEGISGIRQMDQVVPGNAKYEQSLPLMMADINAAVDGAFAGGATEVVVSDVHYGGGQLQLDRMDPRAHYEMLAGPRIMPSLDESFAGVILLGHHAMAGTLNGFLDHTVSSSSWFEYRLNGQPMGEIGIEAAWAGHYNVPVIMVSGDQATADEARALLGEVETAVVKWGIGRNNARCLVPSAAHEIIRQAASLATRNAKQFKAYRPALPAQVELTLYRSDQAEENLRSGRLTRKDARTVTMKIDSLLDVVRW